MSHYNRLGAIYNTQPVVYGDEQVAYIGGSTASVQPTDHPAQVALDSLTHPEPFNLLDHLFTGMIADSLIPASVPIQMELGLTANGQQPYEW